MESQIAARILIVEDDEAFRYVLEKKLTRVGYKVTTAVNGSHAMQILSSGRVFEMVVSDLKMPLKGGLELLMHLKENNPHIPVVILTGYPERQKIVAAAQLGYKDILLKPVQTEDLLAMIERKVSFLPSKSAA